MAVFAGRAAEAAPEYPEKARGRGEAAFIDDIGDAHIRFAEQIAGAAQPAFDQICGEALPEGFVKDGTEIAGG